MTVICSQVENHLMLSDLQLLSEGRVLPSCSSWLPTPLGGSAGRCSGFNSCCCWVGGGCTEVSLFSFALRFGPFATQDWPQRPAPCPLQHFCIGGWMASPLPAGFFFLVPFHTCGWILLPPLSFSRLAWFASALKPDSCRCNSHRNKPAS